MRCKYCGEIIEKDYKFCLSCGKPAEDSRTKEETESIEYFEIETDNVKNKEKYDFSQFLKDDGDKEQEEIEFSTKNEKISEEKLFEEEIIKEEKSKENTAKHKIYEDDIEDTKKRVLFERSDYNFFDNMKKKKQEEKSRKNNYFDDYEEEKSYREEEKENNSRRNYYREPKSSRNDNKYYSESRRDYREDDYDIDFDSRREEELNKSIIKEKKKKRFWKRLRNALYNILVLLGALVLALALENPAYYFLMERGFFFIELISSKLRVMAILLIILFLLIPFFNCKGNAKIPILIFSILTSWTIIGWVVLLIICKISNRKWIINSY